MGFHSYFYMSNCDVISYVIGNYDTFCIKLMSLLQTYVFYLLYLLSCYEIFLSKMSHLESFFIYCVVVYRNVAFSQGRIWGCYSLYVSSIRNVDRIPLTHIYLTQVY